jgi:hypothetical protein
LNVVVNKEYIERLQMVIRQLHKADSAHVESVPVTEVFRGQIAWKGVVEVFNLSGHAKAKRCYAWSHRAGKNGADERFVAVLEIPPVTSPETAVKVAIAAEAKGQK